VRTRRYFQNLFCKLTLAAFFVVAQTAVVGHLDLDQHSQEASCAICLNFSTFDSANVSNPELILPLGYSPQPIHQWLVFVSTNLTRIHRARAPPAVS